LFDPKLQSHPAKGGTISRTLSRPGREGSDKDGLKMGCENAKLFLRKPLDQYPRKKPYHKADHIARQMGNQEEPLPYLAIAKKGLVSLT
jgi:hypothetical protein